MKLSDTQLILLSSASKREDGLAVIPPNLKDTASKVVKPLLAGKLLIEIPGKPEMPIWRRGENGAHALQITKMGLASIGIAEGREVVEPAKQPNSSRAKPKAAKQARAPRARRAFKGTTQPGSRPDSKQDHVIAMLQSPKGVTIKAIEKATGWQPHSVRGFFAGVVRKRLKLKLTSAKVDDVRIYRIVGGKARKPARKASRSR